MPHLHDLSDVRVASCVLTVGSFDGVHLGHQALVRAVVDEARQLSIPSVVLAFHPHPSVVLRGWRPAFYITTPEERAAILLGMGVDYVVTQLFDEALSRVSADDFLDRLQESLHPCSLWVGENFALGHRRQGDVPFLARAGERRGFRLNVHPPVAVDGEAVSSTRVRELLRGGDVVRAARYLGRPFALAGKVVAGAARGKRLSMPTANLQLGEERLLPGSGVYACFARVQGRNWKAVSNIGVRPTFEDADRPPVVEAHLLDFHGDLYGQVIRLAFIERLRDEMRFANAQLLTEQIQRDILRARALLDSRPEPFDG